MIVQKENVKQYIEESLSQLDQDEALEIVKQQVNVRINAEHSFLLTKLAEKLKQSRASVAAALFEAAIIDAWRHADMPTIDVGDHARALPAIYADGEYYDEYREFMFSLGVTVNGYKPGIDLGLTRGITVDKNDSAGNDE